MIFVNEEVCEIVLIIAVLLYSYGSTNYVFSAAVFFFYLSEFRCEMFTIIMGFLRIYYSSYYGAMHILTGERWVKDW